MRSRRPLFISTARRPRAPIMKPVQLSFKPCARYGGSIRCGLVGCVWSRLKASSRSSLTSVRNSVTSVRKSREANKTLFIHYLHGKSTGSVSTWQHARSARQLTPGCESGESVESVWRGNPSRILHFESSTHESFKLEIIDVLTH